MNQIIRFSVIIMLGVCPVSFLGGCSDPADAIKKSEARNIIFMVPDGMGLSNVTVTRTYLYGHDGQRLSFETLPYIGYQRTSSRDSFVTDSAAAGSAWASGEKFNNGEISCLDNNADGQCDGTRVNAETILEMAEAMGLATGLVATSDITHATPAAFGAHVHNRKCESEIFKQLIENDIEVLLGGGIATNRDSCLLDATDEAYNDNLIADARADGYTYVTTETEMDDADADKLLGLFKNGGLTPIYQRDAATTEPTLAEMTAKALEILEDDKEGFFLMVEGSQIDWADHARDAEYMIHEVIDFDNAVKEVKAWMAADAKRSANTLLVVVADHETGGVIIEGPYGSHPMRGDAGSQEITFASNADNPTELANHTAVDTIIWSNRPECGRALENTDLFTVLANFLSAE